MRIADLDSGQPSMQIITLQILYGLFGVGGNLTLFTVKVGPPNGHTPRKVLTGLSSLHYSLTSVKYFKYTGAEISHSIIYKF